MISLSHHDKLLSQLLIDMAVYPCVSDDIAISSMSIDSRHVQLGGLFFALATDADKRIQHIQQALQSGAIVVLVDNKYQLTQQENQLLQQGNIRAYSLGQLTDNVSEIAGRFYNHPSRLLTIVAVTGTNGKTSVTQFIAQALELLAMPCGIIGTLGYGRINAMISTGMTTPDPVTLQAILANFCQQDIRHVVIEASSHALVQGRLNSLAIDVAVLTNLSHDHLDYHNNLAEYAAAKRRLFTFSSIKTAVINYADDLGRQLISILSARDNLQILTYSSEPENGDVSAQASDIVSTIQGLRFNVSGPLGVASIKNQLIGRFNVDNLLAAMVSLHAVNVSFEDAVSAINQCYPIDGRMKVYGNRQQAYVVVDFAHTPDALTKTLCSLRDCLPKTGELWCVFGCGGDRDVSKRKLMGACADQYADWLVLTDDNPRSEDHTAIINDVLSGVSVTDKVYVEHDRKLAIRYAVFHAKPTDIVLIAGKGHETYQELMGDKQPFVDGQVVVEALQAANDETQLLTEVQS